MADDDEQSNRPKDEPIARNDDIDGFGTVLVKCEIADIAAFYFIDSQQKDNEDNDVDKCFLELHDIGF